MAVLIALIIWLYSYPFLSMSVTPVDSTNHGLKIFLKNYVCTEQEQTPFLVIIT